MRILSVDPGYERVGIAIIECGIGKKETLIFSDCIVTDRALPHSQRLSIIYNHIEEVIHTYAPNTLAIETLFFNSNQKTVMKVSESRGVIIVCAAKNNLTVHEYTPIQIKVAVTGYGRSDKKGVTAMVKQLLTITKEIAYDDEYDAIAVGLTCAAITRSGLS